MFKIWREWPEKGLPYLQLDVTWHSTYTEDSSLTLHTYRADRNLSVRQFLNTRLFSKVHIRSWNKSRWGMPSVFKQSSFCVDCTNKRTFECWRGLRIRPMSWFWEPDQDPLRTLPLCAPHSRVTLSLIRFTNRNGRKLKLLPDCKRRRNASSRNKGRQS